MTSQTGPAYMPFSMNLATSPRSVQVHLLMSLSASLGDLNSEASNITTALEDFLARAGSANTNVTVVDANVIGVSELSFQSKGRLEVTLDVALTNVAPRNQIVQAWHNSTIYQDIEILVDALNAATTNQPTSSPPVWQFNRLVFLPSAEPSPPPDNTTDLPGASLVIDMVVNAANDPISTLLEQTQSVVALATAWTPGGVNVVEPVPVTLWTSHLRFACDGPLTHWTAQVRVAFAVLFNVSYDNVQCVAESTTDHTTLWELQVRDPWHRADLLTRFDALELWHDSFLPFVDAPPPNCTVLEGADGVYSALPTQYPSSAAPWKGVAEESSPVCLVRQLVPLQRSTSVDSYGNPPSGPCVTKLCVELSLMSTGSPPLVLDLVEMTHNVQFVNVNATALLLDQFATWTLQTTEEVLDVTLYFRVATTQPHHGPTSTNDVVLAVQLHVLQTADVREVSVTPVLLLDDESTASAGTKSDLTETVLACFDDSYDATWQTIDRCAACHDLTLKCLQSEACAAVATCVGSAYPTVFLSFPIGYVDTVPAATLATCQGRAPSVTAWRQFITATVCFVQSSCPSSTDAVDRMASLTITPASHTLRLPRRVDTARLVFRMDDGTVVASFTWTTYWRPNDLVMSLQSQLANVTTATTIDVAHAVSLDGDNDITITYTNHIGQLPHLVVLTSRQSLDRPIEATQATLVKTVQPLDLSQYKVAPSPCPCGSFSTAFYAEMVSSATSLGLSQPFVDISSVLEAAAPSDSAVTSCFAALSCPLTPPQPHTAVLFTLTPTSVTLLVYPTTDEADFYAADFTFGPVPAVLSVSPNSTGSSLLASLLAQDSATSPGVTIDQTCDNARVCRVVVLLPHLAGPVPTVDVQATTNANINYFVSYPPPVDGSTTPAGRRHQRLELQLF
ncbi:hypothetical protein B5M09_002189 [Aphanomyces astaci]|uniref:Uncharacterized protein n=1 Tax=Aphanomyces astaci TaxID=112090 RepID=A0A425D590_APHAT|nr:hypothetical protein B5M09_002189 [Aphanomyces astaci]